jgi:hypothetical protein
VTVSPARTKTLLPPPGTQLHDHVAAVVHSPLPREEMSAPGEGGGVDAPVGVGLGVGVRVAVGPGVGVRVAVGPGAGVRVAVTLGVGVRVAVRLGVAVR